MSCVDDYEMFLGGVIIDWILSCVFDGVFFDDGFRVMLMWVKGLFECGFEESEMVFIIF